MDKKITIIIFAFLLLGSIGFVSAQDLILNQNSSQSTILYYNLLHTIGNKFSVVGDDRVCGINGNPNFEWNNIAAGTSISSSDLSSKCSNGYGVVDVFNNGWVPRFELPFPLPSGLSGVGCGVGPCNVQIYCCPNKEPTSQSDCNVGTFTQVACSVWGSTGGYQCKNEANIPYYLSTYNFCTPSNTFTCYYKQDSNCLSRTYATGTSCSTIGSPAGYYNGMKLFSSLNDCQGSTSCTNECSPSDTCTLGADGCYHYHAPSNPTNTTNGSTQTKQISLTVDAFNSVDPATIGQAMCDVSSDCSQNAADVVTNDATDVSSKNWTITCIKSAAIKKINQDNYFEYFKSLHPEVSGYADFADSICNHVTSLPSQLVHLYSYLTGIDTCKTFFDSIPSGTCRATEKYGTGLCGITSSLAFISITGDKCTDGGIILVIILALGIFLVTRL